MLPVQVYGQVDSLRLPLVDAAPGDPPQQSIGYRPPDTTSINTTRLTIVGGSIVATIGAIHVYQQNGWWKNNRVPFHFREDLRYALHVDKIGHFHSGSAATFIISKSLGWANFSESNALMFGALGSLLFETYIEIEDGFSTWGFDRVDFAANAAGAFFPVAKYHVPFLRTIDLKFSYRPSPNLDQPGAFQGQRHIFMDDYEGQTFWLSFKINNLLPISVESLWPDFLCLAVGYGARDILGPNPYRVYFVGLDFDMTKIIPAETSFLKTLGEALNFIRLPLPAVRISPNTVWYGIYF